MMWYDKEAVNIRKRLKKYLLILIYAIACLLAHYNITKSIEQESKDSEPDIVQDDL